jgi:hypothetical protein
MSASDVTTETTMKATATKVAAEFMSVFVKFAKLAMLTKTMVTMEAETEVVVIEEYRGSMTEVVPPTALRIPVDRSLIKRLW